MSSRAFVPDGFEPPLGFTGPGFHLEPLGPVHNERDYEAWTSSIDHIRALPGAWSGWPKPMTLEENMGDMEMHAREFADKEAFTYSVLAGPEVIGCLYIYPDRKGPADAVVRSWVTESRAEMDEIVWRAVSDWLRDSWPFESFRYAER